MIRSATPQLSKKVLSLTDGNNNFENAFISLRPSLMIAAYTYLENQKIRQNITLFFLAEKLQILKNPSKHTFVLLPISRPSTKPVPFVCHSLIIHILTKEKERKQSEDTVQQTCCYGHNIF